LLQGLIKLASVAHPDSRFAASLTEIYQLPR
jgi:hypothetical protein